MNWITNYDLDQMKGQMQGIKIRTLIKTRDCIGVEEEASQKVKNYKKLDYQLPKLEMLII